MRGEKTPVEIAYSIGLYNIVSPPKSPRSDGVGEVAPAAGLTRNNWSCPLYGKLHTFLILAGAFYVYIPYREPLFVYNDY